jgi:hypothetical protein
LPAIPISSVVAISTALVVGGILLFYRPLIASSSWRAIVTPLASIMGSGFLVCVPLLYANIGNYAVFAMAGLLCLAYAVGSVIRFNIKYGENLFESQSSPIGISREEHRLHVAHRNAAHRVKAGEAMELLEKTSHFALSGAYCISVSYYLQLLASFALQPLSLDTAWYGKALVTLILAGIGIVGIARGLKGIERVERIVVGFNLAMIAALIAGLIYHNIVNISQGTWNLHHIAIPSDKLHVLRLLMGMLIIVQGFETSRFLGSEPSRQERIRTMKWAQLISAGIYVLFISLMAVVINRVDGGSQSGITAIVGFSKIVAPVLPILLTITAIGSQFSAATADDAGCSGLLEALLKRRIRVKFDYIIVSAAAIVLTWFTDVYQIISFASRAFAFYYALQGIVAILVMRKVPSVHLRKAKTTLFGFITAVCALVTVFGIPAG